MKKETVLLVYPKIDYEDNYKYSWTPFSILSLAGVLHERGFAVMLFDQNSDPNANWFSRIEPHLSNAICVGFSVMTGGGQIRHALELAVQIRENNPSIPLVWGGPHVSALPQQTASHPLVDIAVAGQGDLVFAEIVAVLQAGTILGCVPNVYQKCMTTSESLASTHREFARKSDLPMYPWHLINPEDYIRDDVTINTRTFGYVSSQGCPYRCRFCYEFGAYNSWWSGYEAERLVSDIDQLVGRYRINGVKFYDADFFVNASRVKKFCQQIRERDLSLKWAGSANPNDILRIHRREPEILNQVKASGCTRILMGMESGSDKILQLIDKQITSDQLREVARLLAHYEFIGSFTFIVGFPGENEQDLLATLDLVDYVRSVSSQHETRIHIFAPYPGTPLFDVALQHGFAPYSSLENWADYNYYQVQTPWVSQEMLSIVQKYTHMH